MADDADAMVMTVLEARVADEGRPALEAEFRARTEGGLPPGLVETFLVRDAAERSTWRIVSVWESAGALARMRASGGTPAGVQMFRAAGAEPRLTVFEVLANPRR